MTSANCASVTNNNFGMISITGIFLLVLMSIVDFIAVVSFGLTCFSLGYNLGKDKNKTQK